MHYIFAADNGSESVPCLALLIILLALAIAYVVLYIIQRLSAKKNVVRVCDYCGHAVVAVSACHRAPVFERGEDYFCTSCGKRTQIICPKCKRPLN